MLTVMPHFANKVAQGISVSLGMYILGWAGYDASASVQPDSVMHAINISYNVVPTILLGIMTLLIIILYDLGSRMPMIHKELEARRNQKS